MKTKVSPNFYLEELCVTSTGLPNIPNEEQKRKLRKLALMLLEPIRAVCFKPVKVIRCFSTQQVNLKVGGLATSQHLICEAVDLDIVGMERLEEFKIIATKVNFDQLIWEKDSNCIHVSFKVDSPEKNRHQILVREKVNGKKVYKGLTKEEVFSLLR